jgi:hypothetical protein
MSAWLAQSSAGGRTDGTGLSLLQAIFFTLRVAEASASAHSFWKDSGRHEQAFPSKDAAMNTKQEMLNTTHQVEIVVTSKPNVVRVEGFRPHFSGSPRQKAWAVEIAASAMNQVAGLTTREVRDRLSGGVSWTPADIEIIKERVGHAVAFALRSVEHRPYAGWWINNRKYGPSLFKMAWN